MDAHQEAVKVVLPSVALNSGPQPFRCEKPCLFRDPNKGKAADVVFLICHT